MQIRCAAAFEISSDRGALCGLDATGRIRDGDEEGAPDETLRVRNEEHSWRRVVVA
jgi:hypothetical protein